VARKSRKGGVEQQTIAASQKGRVWNCAVYARLSIEDSGRKGTDTIDTQIELVASYVKQRADLFLVDTYIDNGASGKDFDRPAWNRLMDDIRVGRIDCVCVKDLSRFSRNYIETCEFLEKIFPFMGVRFVSVNDGYDNHVPKDRNEGLIIALKSLVNNQYLKDISRKVSTSIKVRQGRGEYIGAHAPYGYQKSKVVKGKLEIDDSTAPIVKKIFSYRAEGMSHYAICNLLNDTGIPCPSVVLRSQGKIKAENSNRSGIWLQRATKQIVKSRIYLGHLVYGKSSQSLAENKPSMWHSESDWVICENTHEPIISSELWDRANAVEAERRKLHISYKKDKAPLPKNIFQGLLVCGHCNTNMQRIHNAKTMKNGNHFEYYYYGCFALHKHSEGQLYKKVKLEEIYDLVFQLVNNTLQKASNLGAIIEKRARQQVNPRVALESEIIRTSRELETINQRLAGLYESYVDKLLSEVEYVSMKVTYESRFEVLRQKINSLSMQVATVTDISASENRWLSAARDFQNPTELTREMLGAIVEQIKVYSTERVEVVWKFRDEYAILRECVALHENSHIDMASMGREESA